MVILSISFFYSSYSKINIFNEFLYYIIVKCNIIFYHFINIDEMFILFKYTKILSNKYIKDPLFKRYGYLLFSTNYYNLYFSFFYQKKILYKCFSNFKI